MSASERVRVAALAPFLVSAGLTVPPSVAGAQGPAVVPVVTITVDAFGVGTRGSASGTVPLASTLAPDPDPGGLPTARTYDLQHPPGLYLGDVLLTAGVGGPVVDVLRFNNLGSGTLVFYAAGVSGLPGAFYGATVALPVSDVVTYTPAQLQPGFVARASGPVEYGFVTTVAPEPAVVVLVAAGLCTLALVTARRRTCA